MKNQKNTCFPAAVKIIINRITRTEINLDKPIPSSYEVIEVDANDCIVFSNYRYRYTKNEKKVEGDKVDCYVEITGNHGIVTFQTKNEPQKEEPKETIGCGETLGCLYVLLPQFGISKHSQ